MRPEPDADKFAIEIKIGLEKKKVELVSAKSTIRWLLQLAFMYLCKLKQDWKKMP